VGAQGSRGPKGAAGAQGPAGSQGPPGAPGAPAILTGYCNYAPVGADALGIFFILGKIGTDGNQNCFDGVSPANTDAAYVPGVPMPSAGGLQNLTLMAYLLPTASPASFQVGAQVWVNAVATSLTCTLTLVAVNQKATRSDPIDTVAVNAGDSVVVEMTTPSPVNPGIQNLTMVVSIEKQ
jgi:hypothetical protein